MKEREIPMDVMLSLLGPDSAPPLARLTAMFPTLRCVRRINEHGAHFVFKAEYGGMQGETAEFSDLPSDLIDQLIEMTAKLIEVVHGHGPTSRH